MCPNKKIWFLDRLTPFDRKLLVILTILVLASFLLLLQSSKGQRVLVDVAGRTVFVAPLEQDQKFQIEGPLGTTVLQLANGSVQVLSSPCPQKICIGMGNASHTGDLLACAPNRVVVRIEGAAEQAKGYDVLSR